MKRSLRRKVRALGVLQVTLIAGIMMLLGVLFFHKLLADEARFESGTMEVKGQEAEGVAKLLALELGRIDDLRYVRTGLKKDVQSRVSAVLWEKITFIGALDELDLITRGPVSGRPVCIRPIGIPDGCDAIDGLSGLMKRYDEIDHLVQLGSRGGKEIYAMPLYVGGSYWGIVRIGLSISTVQHAVEKLGFANQRDKNAFIVLFVVCLGAVSVLLFLVLAAFFRRIHRPLLALARNAVALGEKPDAKLEPVEADDEDEIGVLAHRFSEMQTRLQETFETLRQAVSQKDEAIHNLEEKDQLLRRSERLASMGVLAAGVAHEIGNKLNPMAFVVHNLRSRIKKGKEIDMEQLDVLNQSITSCTQIMDKLRSLAKPMEEELVPVAPSEIINDVVMLLGAQSKTRGVTLAVEVEDGTEPVHMVRGDMVQVLINLVVNARDAVIQAERSDGEVRMLARTDDDGRVVLEVADNGVGMTEEVKSRIFEPFYTTKGLAVGGSVGGTGLGLYICYGILSRHGVEPDIVTSPGGGTRFVMTFGSKVHSEEADGNDTRLT